MSEHDAFGEEMPFSTLTDRDVDRLLQGRAPEAGDFAELAEFTSSLRLALTGPPAPADASFVTQLADAARSGIAGTADDVATAVMEPIRSRASRRPLVPRRFAALARATAVVALVPLLFAGLAVAGVTLPEPARNVFEAVGVELPNQPADDEQGSAAGEGARGVEGGQGTSPGDKAFQKGHADAARRGHGTAKDNPVRSNPRTHGTQERGYALGKNGLAPGQVQPPGQLQAPGQLQQDSDGNAVGHSRATPQQRSKPSAPPAGRAKAAQKRVKPPRTATAEKQG